MKTIRRFLIGFLAFMPLSIGGWGETTRTKEDVLRIASRLLGNNYPPIPGKPLIGYHNDDIFYQHGSGYVIALSFATNGELARIELIPETLLYSEDWHTIGPQPDNRPQNTELVSMQWMIDTANALRPVGKALIQTSPTRGGCFQSGANNYCIDFYESASIYHYWRDDSPSIDQLLRGDNAIIREIKIGYKKHIEGKIDKIRSLEDASRAIDLRINSVWYRVHFEEKKGELFIVEGIEENEIKRFAIKEGSFVFLETHGCTERKEEICSAASILLR